jgi:hypothetical protein
LDTTKYTDLDQDLLNVCIPCKVFKNLDKRKVDAITINWRPKWVPNLYLGYAFSRQYYANNKNAYGERYSFFSKDILNLFFAKINNLKVIRTAIKTITHSIFKNDI